MNVRAAERALGRAQSPLARSHYEVARRACPRANLRGLARQIDQVDRASTALARAPKDPNERSPEELLRARVLESERLGSIVMWAARACKKPSNTTGAPTCHEAGDADAGWCDAMTQQGLAVRYREHEPEAFRWTATFPPSVRLDCSLFGVGVELEHWTEASGSSKIERSHCRLARGPFDGLELIVDSGTTFNRFSLFSREFTQREHAYKEMPDSPAHRAAP
ncbi:MAG: hypothetical protein JW940_03000 [Polyangiaceae bacterium]|nr:hypothetical protein [Polyangiaceae bacterium]